jgi:hypothetical protein
MPRRSEFHIDEVTRKSPEGSWDPRRFPRTRLSVSGESLLARVRDGPIVLGSAQNQEDCGTHEKRSQTAEMGLITSRQVSTAVP